MVIVDPEQQRLPANVREAKYSILDPGVLTVNLEMPF